MIHRIEWIFDSSLTKAKVSIVNRDTLEELTLFEFWSNFGACNFAKALYDFTDFKQEYIKLYITGWAQDGS